MFKWDVNKIKKRQTVKNAKCYVLILYAQDLKTYMKMRYLPKCYIYSKNETIDSLIF